MSEGGSELKVLQKVDYKSRVSLGIRFFGKG